VLPRTYDTQVCSIARALEVVGDRWTILVIREAFMGTRRFDDFQRNLDCARNVLTDRLNRLVEEGILRRRRYQQRPARYEYVPTRMGVELWPTVMALKTWGDRYFADNGPPVLVLHKGCDGEIDGRMHCSRCRAELEAGDVYPAPGPGRAAASSSERAGAAS
jgi:DNA-binding HxlR family transcriptional regulator